jgi:dephospho-CoA kinase
VTFVLGLTGSIGMGKSATSAMFRECGVPVHDADAAVHALYRGAAVAPIEAAFPGTVVDGVVDRARLGAIVLGDPASLRRLEAIVHPLVREAELAFLDQVSGQAIAVLDIPLLLEAGRAMRCDAVLVVTAPAETQRARVLGRPGMSEAKLDAILAKQMPDVEKRRHAHFLVETHLGFPHARAEVSAILAALAGRPGRVLHRLALGERF